ncbi:response regulator [Azospirillum sp. TSO35-2]|uniref:response regulator n=1 Tax=Azospirillum sp. TSO35-2 TaxID=716796 RepID=UPI000D612DC1|nr:response regulator [Azospirillum sp. TSO35-2]PWC37403.1 regulator [Azospirillum sp. TSO35-2]
MPTVLVIDDEDMVRLVLRQFLERLGMEVVEAQDGEEGLRLFRAHRIDLVICDLIMPRADGIGTIMHIRQIAPKMKIIAISGGGRSHAMELLKVAEEMGADHALAKPFTRDQMTAAVAACLPNRPNTAPGPRPR